MIFCTKGLLCPLRLVLETQFKNVLAKKNKAKASFAKVCQEGFYTGYMLRISEELASKKLTGECWAKFLKDGAVLLLTYILPKLMNPVT